MAEDIGIVMSLYDKVSPTLKAIGNNTKSFDKSLQELEQSCAAYERSQESLTKDISTLKVKLTESNEKVRDATKAWRTHKGELTKGMLDKAISEQTEYKAKLSDTEAALKSQRKAVVNLAEDMRKTGNRQPGGEGSGAESIAGSLKNAGLFKMVGDAFSQMAGAGLESALGQPSATAVSSILSGIASGAAMGMMTGTPHGVAIGAVIGAGAGVMNAVTAVERTKDDAFKGYVQEQAEGALTRRDSDIQSGSATAGQREQDAIAFNRLLGDGKGDTYLSDLRTMAAKTPMEYSDLTGMSRSLATGFKDDPSRMLGLMGSIGDAGSAVGVDADGMNMMATSMSRMQSSGKVTQEYLNLIQERGVDAVGMLSEGLGKTKGEVYGLISKGKLDGVEAVQVLQDKMDEWYGGAMEKQSKTFSGLSSTLSDAETEMRNAYGEGYNDERGKGIADQTEWLSGASGEAQQEANKAIGAWQASLENAKEKYIRDAVDGAMETDEYKKAKAEGDAAEMGRMIMQAKVKGQGEYNANEGKDEVLASELALIDGIREDAASNDAYWNAGYVKGQSFSKGRAAGMLEDAAAAFAAGGGTAATGGYYDVSGSYQPGLPGFAFGLNRVPRDNFPALLHEGERVLTAGQARQQEGSGGGVVIQTGPVTVREEADIGKIAQALMREIERAKVLSAPTH